MDHKKSWNLHWICYIAGAVIGGIGCLLQSLWLGILGLASILAAGVLLVFFYRCPNCERNLPTRGRRADYCPYCGCDLGWEEEE